MFIFAHDCMLLADMEWGARRLHYLVCPRLFWNMLPMFDPWMRTKSSYWMQVVAAGCWPTCSCIGFSRKPQSRSTTWRSAGLSTQMEVCLSSQTLCQRLWLKGVSESRTDKLWKGLVLSICNSYVSMQLNCWTLKGLNSLQPCLRTTTLKVCRYFGVRMS